MNEAFLLDLPGARARYLQFAERALARTDWRALAFGLMSSHTHWAMLSGMGASGSFVQALHAPFARSLNAAHERRGPVFADRYRSVLFEGETACALLAYIHNNPVRAGCVSDPADSPWTSHRAYLGIAPAPPWLDVDLGLHLCGFSATPSGRLAFHDMVRSRASELRNPAFAAADLAKRLRDGRALHRAPIDVATPIASTVASTPYVVAPLVVPPACPTRAPFHGPPAVVLEAVAAASRIAIDRIRGRSRRRDIVEARRMALLVWVRVLERPTVEMTRALGIARSTGSGLLAAPSDRAEREATVIGGEILVRMDQRPLAMPASDRNRTSELRPREGGRFRQRQ